MSGTDAKFDTVFGKDFPIVLASNRHLASIKTFILGYDAVGYKPGQAIGVITSSNIARKYDNAQSDGREICRGILFEEVTPQDFASTGSTVTARVIVKGEVYKDRVVGLDAAGITDLGARTIKDASGVEIYIF